jgi:hypothetical protein
VSYIGEAGQPVIHSAWTAHVPKVVADLAIERGLALDADTEAGESKLKEMIAFRQRPWQAASTFLGVEDTVDLGLNLAERRELADSAA